jgi:hypothetical protein
MNALIKRWPELLRVLLKLAVLAPVVLAFFVQLHRYRSPEPTSIFSPTFSSSAGRRVQTVSERPTRPDQTTTILVTTFAATALLGFAALLFQFVLRRCEHITTIVFFGVVALLMVVNIASEFLGSGLSADLRDDYAYMLLFFAVSVGGVCFESYHQRRVYETHAA